MLAGAFGRASRDNPVLVGLREEFGVIEDPVARQVAYDFQASTTATPLPSAMLDTFVDESLKVPARVWRAIFRGFVEIDYEHELERISAPTLLVRGDRDEIAFRADQELLLEAIDDSRLVVYEGVGHALHWEQPERFAADVAELSRYSAARPLSRSL